MQIHLSTHAIITMFLVTNTKLNANDMFLLNSANSESLIDFFQQLKNDYTLIFKTDILPI